MLALEAGHGEVWKNASSASKNVNEACKTRSLRILAKKPWKNKMRLATRPLTWKLTNLGLEMKMM